MDIFGKKEKALNKQITDLMWETADQKHKLNNLLVANKQLTEENEKLKKELEHRDYIAQGIHNIMTYNGEPQKVV